jgi:hypothetical protein
MSAQSFTKIYAPGIASVGFANGEILAILGFGHGNQVNMVRHKTIEVASKPSTGPKIKAGFRFKTEQ